jgi:hypothetical protein
MAHGKTLYECYKNPSATKIAIWEKIAQEIRERNGYDVDVSANTFHFTVRYMYKDDEGVEHYRFISQVNDVDLKKYTTAVYLNGKFSHNSSYYCRDDEQYNRKMTRFYNRLKKFHSDITLVTYVR